MNFCKYQTDTIAAVSTPKGKAALAIIRISGAETFDIVNKITASPNTRNTFDGLADPTSQQVVVSLCDTILEPRKMRRTTFYDGEQILDEGLFCLFKAPKSYTGEDMAEFYLHGNDFIVLQVLQCLLKYCRLAEKGEFTHRAFLNGKIDLTQAEAIGNLLNAETTKAQKAALLQLKGRLYTKITNILDRLTELRIIFELAIDFVEDEVPEYQPELVLQKTDSILKDLKTLIDTANDGIVIQHGIKICLAGVPNVGKSSIFNAFLQTERAIITPIPGTTRDYLEETFNLDGYTIKLFDTAGIHESCDPIEKIGIDRSKKIIDEVELVLYVSDPSVNVEVNESLVNKLPDEKVIKVMNKFDLLANSAAQEIGEYIPCSTITRDGLKRLKQTLLSRFKNVDTEMESGIVTNTRQLAHVKHAFQNLCKAKEAMQNESGIDIVAFDIMQASNALEEIIGKITPDDLLNKIFENFCIGK